MLSDVCRLVAAAVTGGDLFDLRPAAESVAASEALAAWLRRRAHELGVEFDDRWSPKRWWSSARTIRSRGLRRLTTRRTRAEIAAFAEALRIEAEGGGTGQ